MHRDVLLELASQPSGNIRELNQLRRMAAVTDRAPRHGTPQHGMGAQARLFPGPSRSSPRPQGLARPPPCSSGVSRWLPAHLHPSHPPRGPPTARGGGRYQIPRCFTRSQSILRKKA